MKSVNGGRFFEAIADEARFRRKSHRRANLIDRGHATIGGRSTTTGGLAATPPTPRRYFMSLTPFLPATVFFGPLRVRAFVRVRWPRTGRPRR